MTKMVKKAQVSLFKVFATILLVSLVFFVFVGIYKNMAGIGRLDGGGVYYTGANISSKWDTVTTTFDYRPQLKGLNQNITTSIINGTNTDLPTDVVAYSGSISSILNIVSILPDMAKSVLYGLSEAVGVGSDNTTFPIFGVLSLIVVAAIIFTILAIFIRRDEI